ncbi:MAG: FeoB-associated Cys-rich membrane protein [Firmicutes bacterium]|jgi:hypothetical protein|nr:FeoB-associated Cys-rich membrane protein [Bacillota bacterium]MBR6351700.1 FeoB-associated Cys-rich membrane protein [Bacillota bacterium]
MNTASIIALLAVVLIVSLAVRYIVREKKKGTKCIGCPYAGSCTRYGSSHEDMKDCGH